MILLTHNIINPDGLHDPVPFGYSHTVSIPAGAELVLVSGQYGSGADGMVTSPDFAEQVSTSFDNLEIALAAHGLDLGDVVQLRSYVMHPTFEKLGVIGQAVNGRCGDAPPTQTVIGVAGLAMPDMLFEVEATAIKA
ncbi:Rid family hydrolase [Rhodococcus sp. 077-4]|uniref:Rid family hydrolase n=1 Tax=Rhodococcus sp. 077-4 TaxID=2789271 RepID=UPI0039F54D89